MKADKPSHLTVTILEKEYQVACPAEQQDALVHAAQYLDQQMRKIRSTGKVVGVERIAVMAALNITHEMLQNNGTPGNADDGTQEQLKRLNSKMDKALAELRQLEI